MMPWNRSYMTIQNENDIVVFLMTRTKEREELFKWVGPLAKGKVILIGKKGSRDYSWKSNCKRFIKDIYRRKSAYTIYR